MDSKKLIELLKLDVVPALGCTEPVCAAYCGASAASVLNDTINKIDLEVSPGLFKNGMSAGIPHCSDVGLDYAVAIGAILNNPTKKLELLEDITDNVLKQAHMLIEQSAVSVTLKQSVKGIYAKCTLTGKSSTSICVIKNGHTNIVFLQKDNDILLQSEKQASVSTSDNLIAKLINLKISEIRDLVDNIEPGKLDFLLDGAKMNDELSQYSKRHPIGVGLAAALREEAGNTVIQNGLLSNILLKVVSAAESRLDGCPLPAMSSSGSGTKGLVVTIPVYETGRALKTDKETLLRALALSHLVNRYINAYIGKLSPMCTCVMASSTAASVGVAYLLGGTNEQIGYAIKNMVGTVTGMICDGGKTGCALKVATGTSAAIMSAITAIHNAPLRSSDGICADTPEQCIKNMSVIGNDGMNDTDEAILSIMTKF